MKYAFANEILALRQRGRLDCIFFLLSFLTRIIFKLNAVNAMQVLPIRRLLTDLSNSPLAHSFQHSRFPFPLPTNCKKKHTLVVCISHIYRCACSSVSSLVDHFGLPAKLYAYTYSSLNTHVYIYISIYMYIYICTYINICTYVYIQFYKKLHNKSVK